MVLLKTFIDANSERTKETTTASSSLDNGFGYPGFSCVVPGDGKPLRLLAKGSESLTFSDDKKGVVIKIRRTRLSYWLRSLKGTYIRLLKGMFRVAVSKNFRTSVVGEISKNGANKSTDIWAVRTIKKLSVASFRFLRILLGPPILGLINYPQAYRHYFASYQIAEQYVAQQGICPETEIVFDIPVVIKRWFVQHTNHTRKKVFQRSIIPLKHAMLRLKQKEEYDEQAAMRLIDYVVEAKLSFWKLGIVLNEFGLPNFCEVKGKGAHYDAGNWAFPDDLEEALIIMGKTVRIRVLEASRIVEQLSTPEIAEYFEKKMLECFDISDPNVEERLARTWSTSSMSQEIKEKYKLYLES